MEVSSYYMQLLDMVVLQSSHQYSMALKHVRLQSPTFNKFFFFHLRTIHVSRCAARWSSMPGTCTWKSDRSLCMCVYFQSLLSTTGLDRNGNCHACNILFGGCSAVSELYHGVSVAWLSRDFPYGGLGGMAGSGGWTRACGQWGIIRNSDRVSWMAGIGTTRRDKKTITTSRFW